MFLGKAKLDKFKTKLRFKQFDAIWTKEQPALTKIMSSFEWENMQTQWNILNYRNELYLRDYKFAIEIYGNGNNDRNIDYETKRQKAIKKNSVASLFELTLKRRLW